VIVASIADLRPGMIGFGPINGAARWPVWLGELLLGEGFTVGPLKIEHVFVVTEVFAGTARAVEAMPNGARQVYFNVARWTPEYAYVMLPEDYPGQGEDAAAIARAMIGTPYSFASYPALAAWNWGYLHGEELPDGTIKPSKLEAWIDRRKPAQYVQWPSGRDDTAVNQVPVRLPREAICSVLADQAWALTGKQVMPRGTPHQCVTPGALARNLLQTPGTEWLWPGR
jgi:hypothetical protein